MNNTEFKNIYGDYLAHRWVTSKDKAKAAAQKRAEIAYNKEYYRKRAEAREHAERARRAGVRVGRLLTEDEALTELNAQQRNFKEQEFNNSVAGQIYKNRVNAYMSKGMSKEDAEKQVNRERLAAQAEQMDVDRRNAIARRTGINQGNQVRAAVDYKKQQSTLNRRSERDSKSSIAQMEAAKTRREKSQSTEAKVKRSIDRAAKRVSSIVNSGKASVQKAKDYYNNTKSSVQRISDFTKKTINKYFG